MSGDEIIPGHLNPGADIEDLRREVFLLKQQFVAANSVAASNGLFPLAESPQRIAFMIMPFGPEDLQIVYDDFVKPAIEERCDMACVRGDDMFGASVVMEDVLRAIRNASIVVADLTGQNPNVFYEVGIAHAIEKPVLLLAQSVDDVPFDLRHRRVLVYDYTPRGCKRLEGQVAEHIRQMLDEPEPPG